MAGLNRETGKLLTGWPHVVQSLIVLFTSHFGSRVMRRIFGSDVPRLLGQNITPRTLLRYVGAIRIAVIFWEPRWRVTRVLMDPKINTPENLRAGIFAMTIYGTYRPRGHLGDFTPAPGETSLTITSGDKGIIFA